MKFKFDVRQHFFVTFIHLSIITWLHASTTANEAEICELDSLTAYIEYAMQNNRDLKASFYVWKEREESVISERSLPDPKLKYSNFLSEVETRTGPQQNRIGISQTLPWFGKRRAQEGHASQVAMAAFQEYEAKKLTLRRDVKVIYYELHYLREAIEITKSNIALLKKLETVTQAKVKTGGELSTLIKLQTEVAKLEDQIESLTKMRRPLHASLNNLLNLPIHTNHRWPDNTLGPSIMKIDEQLISLLENQHPDLKAKKHRIESAEFLIEKRRKDFYPDLSFGFDYIDTGIGQLPPTGVRGKDPLIASISFNLPIWRGKHVANLNSAKHRRNVAFYSYEQSRNHLVSSIQIRLNKFEEADRRVHLYNSSLIPLAKSAFDISQESYKNGETTFIELIDSQRSLLEFQLIYEESLKNRLQHAAFLEALVGQDIIKIDNDSK